MEGYYQELNENDREYINNDNQNENNQNKIELKERPGDIIVPS